MAFDTGQVLMGLQRLHRETGDSVYLTAAARAADWLCAIQDRDGAWSRSGDPAGRSITFLTRTAAALLDFGVTVGERRYIAAGERFLDWTATQQLPSGLFRHSELVSGDPYLLHTMMYVLEGYLNAWRVTGEEKWLSCAVRGAAPLSKINLERDPLLFSYYDAELRPRSRSMCMTGLSQWAGVCFDLHEHTQDPGYLQCGSNALYYVMTKQIRAAGRLQGAIAGSTPLWGDYLKWAFPNWNIKFFADALLKFERKRMAAAEQKRLYRQRMGQESLS
jgi:rhamnogalacturonyl hydrolase YesR